MPSPEISKPKLNKVKIYGDVNDITVEVDGVKLNAIASMSYTIDPGSLPVLKLTMIADVSVDSEALIKNEKLIVSDPLKDTAEY